MNMDQMKKIRFHKLGDTFDLIVLIPCIIAMVFYWVGFLKGTETKLYSISMLITHSFLVIYFLRQLLTPNSIMWTKRTIDFRLGRFWARRVAVADVKKYSIDREKLVMKLPFRKTMEIDLSPYREEDINTLSDLLKKRFKKSSVNFSEL